MMCVEIDSTLEATLEPATALSQYAWRFRYPGAPYEPEPEEATKGRALTEQVREEIKKRLPHVAWPEPG